MPLAKIISLDGGRVELCKRCWVEVGFLHMVTAAALEVECLGQKKTLSQLVCGRLKHYCMGHFGLRVEVVGEFLVFWTERFGVLIQDFGSFYHLLEA
jgi:hypothetical protein